VFLPNQKHCHDCFIKEKCRNRKKWHLLQMKNQEN
jgi:hypothetical protein